MNSTRRPPTSLLPAAHCRHYLGDRHPVRRQPVGIHVDLVLPHEPAQRRHFRHAGHCLQVVPQKPVLYAALCGEAAPLPHQRILKYPPHARRIGPEFRLYILGQARQNLREILQRPRARPINVRALFENDVHVGEPEIAEPAHVFHLWSAQHGAHDRVRHLVLQDVRTAVPARVDDHLRVAQVGDGVQRDAVHRPPARQRGGGHEQEHQEPVLRRELDDPVDHFAEPPRAVFSWLSESIRKLPEVTMRSPRSKPLTTSTRPSPRAPTFTSRGSK